MKKLIPVLLLAAAASTLALTGCSAVEDMIYGEQTHQYDNMNSLEADWTQAETVGWMPDDASDIRIRESTDGSVAILGFDSDSDLAESCVETERLSGPTFGDDWAPKKVYVDTVFACGAWAVIPTDDGWYGWTPSAPEEQKAATPEPGVTP